MDQGPGKQTPRPNVSLQEGSPTCSKAPHTRSGREGLHVIELLVVILIIGILAAIALPAFLSQRGKAQDTEAKTTARTAQTAFETLYLDANNYAGDATALKAIEPALGEVGRPGVHRHWRCQGLTSPPARSR